jgi:glycine oxidase
MTTKPQFDCLIVGGGIIGMLTARELHLSGMSVALLDRGEAGKESTWAGGGIISPLYPWRYSDAVNQLAQWSQARYAQLADSLKQESGIDPEYMNNGLLILDMGEAEQATAWALKQGIVLQEIDRETITNIESALGNVPEKALWLPEVAQVRNPRLAASVKNSLKNLGVSLFEQTEVTDFKQHKNRVTGVSTSRGDFAAANIIVAGGAWTQQILAPLGINFKVRPVRGQMILFEGKPGQVKRIVLSKNRYVIPRQDGRILVGSTLEEVGFDKSTTETALHELRQEAVRIIPGLANNSVTHHWAGLRPGSVDGIPYICKHPEVAGLYINAGHYRNGVVLGPASARLMADIVLERNPIIESNLYHIEK